MKHKKVYFISLFSVVCFIGVFMVHMYLSRENWVEEGNAAELWDSLSALFDPMLLMAEIQYICIYLAFFLSFVLKKKPSVASYYFIDMGINLDAGGLCMHKRFSAQQRRSFWHAYISGRHSCICGNTAC